MRCLAHRSISTYSERAIKSCARAIYDVAGNAVSLSAYFALRLIHEPGLRSVDPQQKFVQSLVTVVATRLLLTNAMTLSGVTRRRRAGEWGNLERRVTSDRVIAFPANYKSSGGGIDLSSVRVADNP